TKYYKVECEWGYFKMEWFTKLLYEIVGFVLYIFLIIPIYIVLMFLSMILVLLLSPLKIKSINKYVVRKMKR
ncbi:hypothetical protein DP315_21070, partial [Shigella sonnei]|nr:hypothetical protein [Shigella sonnei]